jgi:hypothetical protein
MTAELGLAEALDGLRQELETAWRRSQQAGVRLRASEITVTLQVTSRREGTGRGRVRWWVVEACADVSASRETVHTCVLSLQPLDVSTGTPLPLDVGAEQDTPGQ